MRRSDPIDTPHGRCVIIELEPDDDVPLIGDERELAAKLAPIRQRELRAGRAAMREVIGMEVPILSNDRGAPVLPAGWVGSITHKGSRAAAIAAPDAGHYIGIDLELAVASQLPIERRVLTPREQGLVRDAREVTLRFAIKEAIYKAIDPIVRRYVGFMEVELELASDSSCAVHIVDPGLLPVYVEAWWQERDGLWLATARARRA